MLEIYSTVYRRIPNNINSKNSIFEAIHLKQLPLNIFVIHINFKPTKFSNKLKPLRIGPHKFIQHLSHVTYEFGPRWLYISYPSNSYLAIQF